MATAEELRVKEHMWQQQILLLQNKCKQLEDRVDKKLDAEENIADIPVTVEESNDLSDIKKEISATLKQVSDLNNNLSEWFQNANQEIEDGKQHSRKNNVIIKGLKNVPNIYGFDFISYIAEEMNYMFPSLNGTILPCHIDDAHPMKTKRGGSVIIVRFVNRWMKDLIIKYKYDLPHYLNVTEHLTDYTRNLLTSVQTIVGHENAWTYKTAVFARVKGRKRRIRNCKDIDSLSNYIKETSTPMLHDNSEDVHPDSANNIVHTQEGHRHHTPTLPSHSTPPNRGRPRGQPSRNGRGGLGRGRGIIFAIKMAKDVANITIKCYVVPTYPIYW